MKTNFLSSIALPLLVISFFSCGTVRNVAPSRIGLLPLDAYQFNTASLQSDTSYRVIRSEDVFNTAFTSTDAAARRPSFDGQMVVAILFKQPVDRPVQFERAEVTGHTMTVYAGTCTGAGCQPRQAVLATTPKVGNVTEARFVIDGQEKALVRL